MTDADGSDLTYAAALAELEAITAELDGRDVDVDRLTQRVTRANELIAWCRERLTATQADVERLVADLNDPTDT